MRTFLIVLVVLAVLAFLGLRMMGSNMPAEMGGESEPAPSTDVTQPGAPTVTATPVVVEIDRTQPRQPANGGSAVLLFTDAPQAAERNMITCLNVWNLMDPATTEEVRIGLRKSEDGVVEALRPLYWLNRTALPAGEHDCSQLMANYDFPRARTVRDKFGLTDAGPYFVVSRADEQVAAVIDLTGRSDREIADLVRYFRDGFAYQNDIWDPARSEVTARRAQIASFFGTRFRESFVSAVGSITSPAVRVGCRLGDLADAPCT